MRPCEVKEGLGLGAHTEREGWRCRERSDEEVGHSLSMFMAGWFVSLLPAGPCPWHAARLLWPS